MKAREPLIPLSTLSDMRTRTHTPEPNEPNEPSASPARHDQRGAPDRPRVLLLDDDDDLRVCLVRLLARRALVEPAGTSLEALEHLREATFDVVLSDQHLQGELGSDFLAQASLVQPKALLLLMSSDDVPSRFTGRVTWHHFLRKPFDPQVVLDHAAVGWARVT